MRVVTLLVVVGLGLIALGPAQAQRGRRGAGGGGMFSRFFGSPDEYYQPPDFHGNPEYDGRFTFARIEYRGFDKWAGKEGPGWAHDYPDADQNLMKIMRDVTNVSPFVERGPIVGAAIIALDDRQLFKYPVSYMSEPGGWHPNDKEIAGLRTYLLKGGFMIFDDFREGGRWGLDWTNLRAEMARALPDGKWIELTGAEPIFHSFFDIDLQKAINPTSAYGIRPPTYWGIYENNDPAKRLMVIADVDNDIGESWQWAPAGFIPVDSKNETFKIGVNYIVYALTH